MVERAPHEDRHGMTRRGMVAGITAATVLCGFGAPVVARTTKDPIVRYMNRVALRLQRAAKASSSKAFLSVVRLHADVPGIALYSLGRYRGNLRRNRRKAYYRGVSRLVANYFADQNKQYRVVKVEIGDKSWRSGKAHMIDSKVTLKNGSRYTIRWRLVRKGKRLKVADVRIVGFLADPVPALRVRALRLQARRQSACSPRGTGAAVVFPGPGSLTHRQSWAAASPMKAGRFPGCVAPLDRGPLHSSRRACPGDQG